jgi:YHS domain-containing protein
MCGADRLARSIRRGSPDRARYSRSLREEITVSILAEIIEVHGAKPKGRKRPRIAAPDGRGNDPIGGMSVDVGAAKYKSEFQGNSFNLCRAGRKQTFDKQPDTYALATVECHRRPGNLHSGSPETSFTFCFGLRRCRVNTWKAG